MRHGSLNPSAPETKPGGVVRRPAANLGAEFNNFLFAIAAETDGGTVSVLSALARLDLDPWGEAAKLARLPKELAAHRLAGLIAPCTSGTAPAQARRTAAKLVALLPSGFTIAAPQTSSAAAGAPADGGEAASGPAITHARSILAFLLIFVVAMLSIQCIARITAMPPHNPTTHLTAPPAGPLAASPPARPGHIER